MVLKKIFNNLQLEKTELEKFGKYIVKNLKKEK